MITIVFLIIVLTKKQSSEEFRIYNSVKNSYGNYKSVALQVIANQQSYKPEEMLEKVKPFYCEYEMVDELTINLYDCVKDLEQRKNKVSRVYRIIK